MTSVADVTGISVAAVLPVFYPIQGGSAAIDVPQQLPVKHNLGAVPPLLSVVQDHLHVWIPQIWWRLQRFFKEWALLQKRCVGRVVFKVEPWGLCWGCHGPRRSANRGSGGCCAGSSFPECHSPNNEDTGKK